MTARPFNSPRVVDKLDTLSRLRPIVARELAIHPTLATPALRFVADVGASDLALTSIMVTVEEAFNIRFSDAEFDAMPATVGELVALIDRKKVST